MRNNERDSGSPAPERLSGKALEAVAGGGYEGISSFRLTDEGKWYTPEKRNGYIYRVRRANDDVVTGKNCRTPAALLDRFRVSGSEAWYCGTVTEEDGTGYNEIPQPAIVHDDKQYPSVL